jgi:chromosomal replication initiation ATPase DnaA
MIHNTIRTSGILTKTDLRCQLTDILQAVSQVTNIPATELGQKNREQLIVDARAVYCVVAHGAGYTRVEIGAAINRHHSTVTHHLKIMQYRLKMEERAQNHVKRVEAILYPVEK